MKARLLLPLSLAALSLISTFAQEASPPGATTVSQRLEAATKAAEEAKAKLTKFSLDFPGGAPQQLVTAIEKAMSKPLNVIIPPEHADFRLPPLKMNNINVEQLFKALEATGRKSEAYISPGQSSSYPYQIANTSYGFRTPGAQSDDSIWYFYVEKPVKPPQVALVVQKTCRFYPLTSYLERGLTVDDITTAIQTGWKMLGDQETPTINFHKETKLLIAVGEQSKLLTIDAVLEALGRTPPGASRGSFSDRVNTIIQRGATGSSSPAPAKPAEKPKTEN